MLYGTLYAVQTAQAVSLLCCRHGDGAYYEHGPRTLRPSGVAGANTLQLIEEIGLGVSGIPVKYIQGDTSGRQKPPVH